jgi:hypothetical protein
MQVEDGANVLDPNYRLPLPPWLPPCCFIDIEGGRERKGDRYTEVTAAAKDTSGMALTQCKQYTA